MIYIASPYSAPKNVSDTEAMIIREQNYVMVRMFQTSLFKHDPSLAAISPIVLMHEAAKKDNMPTDAASYWTFNKALIDAAKAIMVLRLPSWEYSLGVQQEIEYAKSMNYSITFVDPWTYDPMVLNRAL